VVKEKQLRRAFPDLKLSVNRTYKELTSLGVGRGVIPFLAEVSDEAMLEKLLKYLHCRRTPFLLLGAGTNLVGSDTECYEMAIRLSGGGFSDFEIQNDLVICGAFAKLPLLTAAVAKAGLCGFAAISGIPGSVGGALRMNAGAGGVEIGSFVREVSGFYRDGRKWKASGREIEWVYRGNSIPHDVIITRAVFRLTPGSAEEEERAIAAELEKRKKREPAGRSAGCAFRNVSDLEPAGMLIDRCGLRGLRVGDLLVSEKHANYLLNTGDASEADYIRMIQILRRAVSEKYGFYLRTEIVPVNPLTAEKIEKDTPSPRINLLYGGVSSEREISLQSGAAVCKALRNGGFKVDLTDIRRCAVTPLMSKCDVVYPVLHGGFGEGGELQKKLEDASLRFVGSGSTASALVMDKLKTKELLKEIGLPTAPWARVTKENSSFPEGLNFPVMIKAPCEGSTVGIVKVNSIEEWGSKLAEEFKFADELLVEEFIQGVEITVPVINATALEVIEIVPPNGGFYDWDAKYVYNNGQTEYLCPPRSLDEKTVSLAKEYALKFYHAARCRDILRVDFIVKEGVPYMLEGNSLPGNTDHSLVPKAARHGGISMEALTAKLVYAAMKRSGEPENRPENMETGFFSSRLTGILAKTARWFFRMTLILCGVLLIFAGVQMRHTGTAAIPLFAGGILLFLSEIMFSYFKLLEKK